MFRANRRDSLHALVIGRTGATGPCQKCKCIGCSFIFSELPLSTRTLFTATLTVLGIGYVFAMIQIYEVHSGLDGKAGLSARTSPLRIAAPERPRSWSRPVRTDLGDAAGERKGGDHRMGA